MALRASMTAVPKGPVPRLLPSAARLRPQPRPLMTARANNGQQQEANINASAGASPPEKQKATLVAPGSSLLVLSFKQGVGSGTKVLEVDRALLWHASPVLRGAIESAAGSNHSSGGGAGGSSTASVLPIKAAAATTATATASLALDYGSPADWEAVLQVLQLKAPPVDWANVEQLLRLADKYDMDAVRSTCAAFLACNISQMALSHPLDSPRNLLHAASLAERYLKDRFSSSAASSTTSISVSAASASASAGPSSLSPSTAQSYVEAISAALGKALEPARFKGTYTPNSYSYSGRQPEVDTWRENARPVVARLAALMEEAKGRDILTPDVQDQVMELLLSSLTRLTS
ncbi:hypothetical protein CHLRE_03g167850v5 [Chlamydomonas reinhardtii]|uniref:Uncharacterized protein n=1 Tax=Chlamydomonas reinhardtii TaxID=3055 RepID=A0A2K3DWV3_CHLRE|nr:uncharacterized protein CHLRE_03g167850v5 [Chlamydomonas reinhardtii]PNW85011.1 hypothetical protein CHLRE_03g167850v5 [Chlamydomonas reinhardtii]